MEKRVLSYVKKVVDAKVIRSRSENIDCVGDSLLYITYLSQDNKVYEAIINATEAGETLYDNYGDYFKGQTDKKIWHVQLI